MRILLVLATALLPYTVTLGQQVYSFNDPASEPIRAMGLDSIYQSGAHADSAKAVFGTEQEEFIAAYQGMLQDLGKYLKAHDFVWEQPVKGFNRIYFSKEGRIDYFLYSFRPGQLTVEQEKRFDELLKGFAADYRFPMTAEIGFAQCSPVTYMPPKK